MSAAHWKRLRRNKIVFFGIKICYCSSNRPFVIAYSWARRNCSHRHKNNRQTFLQNRSNKQTLKLCRNFRLSSVFVSSSENVGKDIYICSHLCAIQLSTVQRRQDFNKPHRRQLQRFPRRQRKRFREVLFALVRRMIQWDELLRQNFPSFSCPHCANFEGPWEELAENFAGISTVRIAEMNCSDYRKICKSFKVNEYPYIQLFRNGKSYQRFGNEFKRTKENMISFLKKHLDMEVTSYDVRDET